ncbi:MAG: ornithine cyclodeaminase family protein [Clostridia bacterium]|nr:ornithine cyclodeaminase family protein [Clostridia bacterium]
MLVISQQDTLKAVSMAEVMEVVRKTYGEYSAGSADSPLRTAISIEEHEGVGLFMPAFSPEAEAYGVKVVSVFPGNVKHGLPTTTSLMVLNNASTGEPEAIIEGGIVTKMRTGAAAGVATDYLARKDARIVALIGAGGQAFYQLEALLVARPVVEIRIYDIEKSRAEALAEEVKSKLVKDNMKIIVSSSAEDCVRGADIITTVTTSNTPTFPADALAQGVHINGMGSFTPDMQEIDEKVICSADKLVVDALESALAEPGDLVIPINKGRLQTEVIYEIGEIVLGKKSARENDNELTVFKSTGVALLDITCAKLIYKRALEKGLGQQVDLL